MATSSAIVGQTMNMAKRQSLHQRDLASAPAAPTRSDGKIESPEKAAKALQAPWRPDSEELAQDQAKIARRHLDQVAFTYFREATEPASTGATGFTDMGKTPFHPLTPQALQPLTALSAHAPTIAIRRRLILRRFVRPTVAMTTLRLRNISPPAQGARQFQRAGLVIALVRHGLFDLRRAAGLLHVDLRLRDAVAHRLGVTVVGRRDGCRQHQFTLDIQHVFRFVSQVRGAVFHLGNAAIGIAGRLPIVVADRLIFPLFVKATQIFSSR